MHKNVVKVVPQLKQGPNLNPFKYNTTQKKRDFNHINQYLTQTVQVLVKKMYLNGFESDLGSIWTQGTSFSDKKNTSRVLV